MYTRIEMKKLEQYSFKGGEYEVVLEYVEGERKPLTMEVTIYKVDSSGVLVLKTRPALDMLITLLSKAASLDDEKKNEQC